MAKLTLIHIVMITIVHTSQWCCELRRYTTYTHIQAGDSTETNFCECVNNNRFNFSCFLNMQSMIQMIVCVCVLIRSVWQWPNNPQTFIIFWIKWFESMQGSMWHHHFAFELQHPQTQKKKERKETVIQWWPLNMNLNLNTSYCFLMLLNA